MKISKLFHWLYAILMLLPVFAIGVTCAYVIFNKNAYKSYSGQDKEQIVNYTSVNNVPLNETIYSYVNYSTEFTNTGSMHIENFSLIATNITSFQNLTNYENVYYIRYYSNRQVIVFDSNYSQLASGNFNSSTYLNISYKLMAKTSDLVNNGVGTQFSYINTESFSFIDNTFYYAIDKVEQSPLFSWAYDSFLTAPIEYIVDLFSMPVDSPVVLMLSYWLTISIVWLCFDLVMYVPLLVHRWIDKGVLE